MTRFYLIITGFVLFSCVNDETNRYLFEYLGEPSNSSENYYLIDMLGCDSCISNNFEFLYEKEVDITLIFVGKIHSTRWRTAIGRIEEKYKIIYDEDRMAVRMGLGLSNPLLVVTSEGKVLVKKNVKDSQLYILLELED